LIGIVDYGLGNILAISNIYKKLGVASRAVSSADDLMSADRLILPGVGAFDWAMERLIGSGLRDSLDEAVLRRGKPVLGICVGMQMMARRSDEGALAGLGWIDGEVKRFEPAASTPPIRLPHMGWNDVAPRVASRLFAGLGDEIRFYFLHSYYWVPAHDANVIATAEYGTRFACCAGRDNIVGVQFHPEKSHHWGVKLLQNFSEL